MSRGLSHLGTCSFLSLAPATEEKGVEEPEGGVRAVGQERVSVEEEERQSRVCSENRCSACLATAIFLHQKPGGEKVK